MKLGDSCARLHFKEAYSRRHYGEKKDIVESGMAGLFQNVGWKAASSAAVLSVVWLGVGASPVLIQHKLISELIIEAGDLPILVNAPPQKTHAWLQHQLVQNEVFDFDVGEDVQVKGYGEYRVVGYDYEVQMPLFRNIYYVMRFSGSS